MAANVTLHASNCLLEHAYILVKVQSHMLVLTLLGWWPSCAIQFWVHHTESRFSSAASHSAACWKPDIGSLSTCPRLLLARRLGQV